ncbi:MAG: hypothetical protein IKE43_12255 [Coriobacteriales bacterium]|nr:hypothetical protein [Coriobacteriales bacterium]
MGGYMGGRGSSSGMSKYGNPYGSQYHSLLTVGNIKFVEKNSKQSETLMETMTKGRVYVRVDESGKLREIVYFDNNNKRVKQIDLAHLHDGINPHTHHGYEHNENDSAKGYSNLTTEEKKMVERVRNIWDNTT